MADERKPVNIDAIRGHVRHALVHIDQARDDCETDRAEFALPHVNEAAWRICQIESGLAAVDALIDELGNAAAMAESEAAARHFDEHAQTLLAKAKRWRDLIAANRGGNRA